MKRKQPEKEGAKRLVELMIRDGWWIRKLHGNVFQSGLPDYVAAHRIYGMCFIETKAPGGFLSETQRYEFMRWHKVGVKIFVVHDEKDYDIIKAGRANWMNHMTADAVASNLPSRFVKHHKIQRRLNDGMGSKSV
jgi:hypothetical protein